MHVGMEIDAATAYGPRSLIADQVRAGLRVRRALLARALEG